MTPDFPVPAQLDRLQRTALAAGVAGMLLTLVGGAVDATQFFRSYLFAFLFWTGLSIGCLSILMIHHLSGGIWGLAIRRLLEAGARTIRVSALLFVPLVFGLSRIYLWAQPEAVGHDAILQAKQPYLNVPFFIARSVLYFAAWWALAHFLSKWSLELDGHRESLRIARRLRSLAGPGLVIMGLTITFSSVDWAMSLNPHWFSTVYGLLFMVGQVLSAMALVIVVLAAFGHEKPLVDVARPAVVHDLGKLMLAFIMLWAYLNLSQFLITWSGNLPEEIPWYLQRLGGGWQYLALALVLFHFALPFLLLLSRDLKRDARLLALVAAGVLVVRLLDLFWLVAPDLQAGHGGEGAHHGFAIHWLDFVAPIGMGGLWLAAFARELRGRPLLPLGEPELTEFIEMPAHAGGH
jgi:hypothetical protein